MSDWLELLQEFNFPHTRRGGVTLVARQDAPKCVELIYAQGWRFLGFDSFTVTSEFIQPHLEWTEDWSRSGAPDMQAVLQMIASHPNEVTHYEFVFSRAG
jgi:hypothetical protein